MTRNWSWSPVRKLAPDAVILTNGFSCHENIRQGTGREVMHLAELPQMAHHQAGATTTSVS